MKRLISSILFPIALTAALPVGAQIPCDTFGEPEVSAGIVEELVIAENNDGLQPGETIWVCNAQHIVKTEDTEVRIQADGTATLPIIGAVRLAGLTISEAERTVQDAYRASGVYIHLQVRILRE
ncbi:MAG: polysaccharide biosynthesis/export family protein [Kiritimatiellae bacterium]|nr:polysaccharide biosynthesis/export family protein [Kiritimatiellia bacterium]